MIVILTQGFKFRLVLRSG